MMSKKRISFFIAPSLVVITAIILIAIFYLSAPPKEVKIKASITKIDKQNGAMRMVVRRYNLRSGKYRAPEIYLIKGVIYQPVKIGQLPPWCDNWMISNNGLGRMVTVDLNRNGKIDKNEREVDEFKLLKDMGVNTIRLYSPPGMNCSPDPYKVSEEEILAAKKIFSEIYSKYGIMVIMGHNLEYGLDYSNPKVRQSIHDEVMDMVKTYKDEPWVLLWNLGNENNIRIGYTSGDFAHDYYKETVQWIASDIKKIDPNHLISISNMGLVGIYSFDKYCDDVDIYGANMYQSKSFSGLWNTAARINRPAYLTEFGCDALDSREDPRVENEELQAEFVKQQWKNIEANYYSDSSHTLGGIFFEWCDEWWKEPYDDASTHTYEGGWDAPTFDSGTRKSGNEEWWGICAQEKAKEGEPRFIRLRKVYYVLKELWNK